MVGSDNRACGTNGVPDDDIPAPAAIGSGVTKVFGEVRNPVAARSRSGPVSTKINGGDRPASPSESLGNLPGRGCGRTEPVHNECPSRAIRCSPVKPGESKSDHALSLKAPVLVPQGLLAAQKAHDARVDLRDAVDDFYPHGPFVPRMWELHPNVTSYDATYVVLAESLGAPLATLDRKLCAAPGTRCEFLSPS